LKPAHFLISLLVALLLIALLLLLIREDDGEEEKVMNCLSIQREGKL
jgi:hypothetical protein